MHGGAHGDAITIAEALRDALEHTTTPFKDEPPADTGLPNDKITDIIGGTSSVSGIILAVDVDRKEQIHDIGLPVKPSNLVDSNFNFQKLGKDDAGVVAEFSLRPDEVDTVVRSLRKHRFHVTAVHNHELFEKPHLYYLHAFATGAPLDLAAAIREALNHTNSELK